MTNSQSYDDTYLQDKLTVTDHLNFILSTNPVNGQIKKRHVLLEGGVNPLFRMACAARAGKGGALLPSM